MQGLGLVTPVAACWHSESCESAWNLYAWLLDLTKLLSCTVREVACMCAQLTASTDAGWHGRRRRVSFMCVESAQVGIGMGRGCAAFMISARDAWSFQHCT